MAQLDWAVAEALKLGRAPGAEVNRSSRRNDFKTQWIDDRTSYHHDHHTAFVELFINYHTQMARAKNNMLLQSRPAHRAVIPQQSPQRGYVMWECPHPDCRKTHPHPFRDADIEEVAQHIVTTHASADGMQARRKVVWDQRAYSTAKEQAGRGGASSAPAPARGSSNRASATAAPGVHDTTREGLVAGSKRSRASESPAVSEAVAVQDRPRSNRGREAAAETRRQAEADLQAADMSWSQFAPTTPGVCERYGDKCWAPKGMRLVCPSCKITFHPLCVYKVDERLTAACPCKPI